MRRPHRRYFLDGRDHPKRYTTGQIVDLIVDDHTHTYPTELAWMVIAIEVIARRERKKPEDVFATFNAACRERTGRNLNPYLAHAGELA